MAKKNKTPRLNKVSLFCPSADHSILFHVAPLKSNVTYSNFYRCNMNVVIVIVIVIVMGLNVIFACNVRCKEPMGGQRGFGFRGKIRMLVI